MSSSFRTIVFSACAALFAAAAAGAQSLARTSLSDSRWDAWLGCWGIDTNGTGHQQSTGVTCIVPVAGSHAVEALTFARGRVVGRDRLDSNGEPHSVSGQGCRGFETIDWSGNGRRALLRSDYVCGSTKGSSSTIYAIAPGGDWLRIEQVRSAGGIAISAERRRPVALLAEVPQDAARAIDERRLAISTARAAAAAPITPDEVVEAVHVVDAGVVRSWILASGQSFDLDGADLAAMIRADVPQSVLQAMMAADQGMSAPALEPQRVYGYPPAQYGGVAAYANATANSPDMSDGYGCPPGQCNVVPNPYSILNGYGVNPYGYSGYPYSPFGSFFPGAIVVTTPRGNNNNNNGHGNSHRPVGHQQPFMHQPVGRQPIAAPAGRRR